MLTALFRDIWSAAWRNHFDLPPPLHAALVCCSLGLMVGAGTTSPGGQVQATGVWLAFVIGVTGSARWLYHRKHASKAVVVALFSGVDVRSANALQRHCISLLADRLTQEEMRGVHAIPVVVGENEPRRASRLVRRLGASSLLYGHATERNSWNVRARIVEERDIQGWHWDQHTADTTPSLRAWYWLVSKLTPSPQVEYGYPSEFTNELEAIISAIAGEVAYEAGDFERAVRLIEAALRVAPASRSHRIDELRCVLAWATFMARKETPDALVEANQILEARIWQGDASAELIRLFVSWQVRIVSIAEELGEQIPANATASRIELLRKAADQRSDPLREMTLYNLAIHLFQVPAADSQQECIDILTDLANHSRYYRHRWYVTLALGARHWYRAEELARTGDAPPEGVSEYRMAAQLYARAIRERPRYRLFRERIMTTFPIPPSMLANTRDACLRSEYKRRAAWYELRFQVARKRAIKRGLKAMRRHAWDAASDEFERAAVGRQDDAEVAAITMRAVCLHHAGANALAEAVIAGARARSESVVDETLAIVRRADIDTPIG